MNVESLLVFTSSFVSGGRFGRTVPFCMEEGVEGDGGRLSEGGGTSFKRCSERDAGREASKKRAEGIA